MSVLVFQLELILRMEDKMNRHLMCDFDEENDSAQNLTEELFDYGLINDVRDFRLNFALY